MVHQDDTFIMLCYLCIFSPFLLFLNENFIVVILFFLPSLYIACHAACSVARLCPTLCDSMDCSPPGYSSLSMGFFQAKLLQWVPFPAPGDLPDPGIKPASTASALAGGFFIIEPPGKPILLFCE